MEVPEIGKERHFLLEFICEECEKTHRLHQLNNDFMGRMHCIYCNFGYFRIQKRFVTEAKYNNLNGKDRVVLTEITKVKWRG